MLISSSLYFFRPDICRLAFWNVAFVQTPLFPTHFIHWNGLFIFLFLFIWFLLNCILKTYFMNWSLLFGFVWILNVPGCVTLTFFILYSSSVFKEHVQVFGIIYSNTTVSLSALYASKSVCITWYLYKLRQANLICSNSDLLSFFKTLAMQNFR